MTAPPSWCIRVVSSTDKNSLVRKLMLGRYKDAEGLPPHFSHRSKAIALFQKLDGVDVLVFVMYVQEYGAQCPAPNTRKVYISYLDRYDTNLLIITYACLLFSMPNITPINSTLSHLITPTHPKHNERVFISYNI
jgi:hypothetical protein